MLGRSHAAWLAVLSVAAALAHGATPAPANGGCDPGLELCLLTERPWVAPQQLRYAAPADAAGPLRLRWKQGARSGSGFDYQPLGSNGVVQTWGIRLPAGLRDGSAALTATLPAAGLQRSDEGGIRSAVGARSLNIERKGRRQRAELIVGARREVSATLKVRLIGRRSGARRILGRWQTSGRVAAGPARKLPLLLATRKLQRRCVLWSRCRLRAKVELRAGGARLTRIGAEGAVPSAWRPGLRSARRYAKRRAGTVRFALVEPSGRLTGYREGSTSAAASLIKPILMAAYLRKLPNESLPAAQRNLISRMIRVSDNGAAVTLRNQTGGQAIDRLARAAGMRDLNFYGAPGYTGGLSQISARDQARFFFLMPKLLPSRHRGFALSQLASITPAQRWGIARAPTHGWKLHFKGGWGVGDSSGGGTVNHQSALLRRGRCRIGLSILTNGGPGHGYGTDTQRGVAERLLGGIKRLPC